MCEKGENGRSEAQVKNRNKSKKNGSGRRNRKRRDGGEGRRGRGMSGGKGNRGKGSRTTVIIIE